MIETEEEDLPETRSLLVGLWEQKKGLKQQKKQRGKYVDSYV